MKTRDLLNSRYFLRSLAGVIGLFMASSVLAQAPTVKNSPAGIATTSGGAVSPAPAPSTNTQPSSQQFPVAPAASPAVQSLVTNATTAINDPKAPPPPLPWNDPRLEDCGQVCLYEHANEILSNMARTTQRELDMLHGKVETDDGYYRDYDDSNSKAGSVPDDVIQKKTDQYVHEYFKGFCLQDASGNVEPGRSCYHRYLEVQRFTLKKISAALASNEDMLARLKGVETGKVGVIPPPTIVTFSDPKNPGKKAPHTTFFPSFKELVKYYQQLDYKKLQTTVTDQYAEMVQGGPYKPSPDDFVIFKPVPTNPKNKKSDTLMVAQQLPNGQFAYDIKKYQLAMRDYQDYQKRLAEELKNLKIDPAKAKVPVIFAKTTEAEPDKERAYSLSRADFINTHNGFDLGGKSKSKQSLSAVTRNTASFRPKNSNDPAGIEDDKVTGDEVFPTRPTDPKSGGSTVSVSSEFVDETVDALDDKIKKSQAAFQADFM